MSKQNMLQYKFTGFHIYPTSFETLFKTETINFKPIFYFLKTTFDNGEIYIVKDNGDEELVWRISKYGNTAYVVRYFNGYIFARYTLVNGLKQGYVYIYSDNLLSYILNYSNNNLHGKQFILRDCKTIFADHGKINDKTINDVHKISTDLLKWY